MRFKRTTDFNKKKYAQSIDTKAGRFFTHLNKDKNSTDTNDMKMQQGCTL